MSRRPQRLWVTRSAPEAEASAERLRQLGCEPVVAPVLRTRPLAGVSLDLEDVDALAFTSRAAIEAFCALSPRRDLPVFTVGEATADQARHAGFVQVCAAQGRGDVRGLAQAIGAAEPRPLSLLNPTALEPAADLAGLLAAQGVAARAVAVYQSEPTALTRAPADLDGVVIHSAKAGRLVAQLTPSDQAAGLTVYALSDSAAGDLRQLGFERILVAEQPNEASLMKRIVD